MKTQIIKYAAFSLLFVVISTSTGHGKPALNGSESESLSLSNSISGSWYFTVTSDSAPAGFRAMISFGDGGELVASAQGDILLNAPPGVPPIATVGHGAWVRNANREYVFSFRQIFYNADGSYAGGAKIRNVGSIDKTGMNMTGQLTFEYIDANDQPVFSGTGTFNAVRIAADAF